MKKLLSFLIAALFVINFAAPVYAVESYTPNFEVEARAVYLYNLDTESLIYEKNASAPMYPASVTKIMTCILALENASDLDREIVVYPQYVQDYLYDYQYIKGNGVVSNAGLLAGEELTMRQALYALMLPSANEVAMSLADHLAGSQDAFAAMMNKRATELGATGTNFVNANGLFDENHVTTARDLFLITRHAMSVPGFMDIVGTTAFQCPPTNKHDTVTWISTNKMMMPESNQYYYAPLKGIKTGSLPESGRCFVSTATKDGFTYLLVVLGAPYFDESGKQLEEQMAFVETKKLYTWVFDTFRVKTLVDKGKHVDDIEIRLNLDQDRLQLMTSERITALMPNDIEASQVTFVSDKPEYVNAPVKKGDVIGEVALMWSGEELGRVQLLAAKDVAASPVLVALEQAKDIMSSFWFKFAATLIIILIVLYVILMMIRNRNRKRSGYVPRRRL